MERQFRVRKNPYNGAVGRKKLRKFGKTSLSSSLLRTAKRRKRIIKSYVPGSIIGTKYEVIELLGKGGFGEVYKVKDLNKNENVAIKIIKEQKKMQLSDLKEHIILTHVKDIDPKNEYGFVHMLDCFPLSGNTFCIVLQLMASSIYDFFKSNAFYPFKTQEIKKIAYQLCRSIKFLHENKITHCDLKLENILFVNTDCDLRFCNELQKEVKILKNFDIRVCDLGCAIFDDDTHPSWVGTRHYIPPEQVLCLKWSNSFDIWSIGCILFELFSGEQLFKYASNALEHMACMENVLGPSPKKMLRKSKYSFDRLESYKELKYIKDDHHPLFSYIEEKTEEELQLFDLISKMLQYEPKKRLTCQQALDHVFLKQ